MCQNARLERLTKDIQCWGFVGWVKVGGFYPWRNEKLLNNVKVSLLSGYKWMMDSKAVGVQKQKHRLAGYHGRPDRDSHGLDFGSNLGDGEKSMA